MCRFAPSAGPRPYSRARAAGRVDLEGELTASGRVAIRVADDGPGFAPALLDGESFGGSSKLEGSGLGLPLAKAVAEASGGSLSLANQRDCAGAVAIAKLPRAAC
jgi:signal transduction histidine kinase